MAYTDSLSASPVCLRQGVRPLLKMVSTLSPNFN